MLLDHADVWCLAAAGPRDARASSEPHTAPPPSGAMTSSAPATSAPDATVPATQPAAPGTPAKQEASRSMPSSTSSQQVESPAATIASTALPQTMSGSFEAQKDYSQSLDKLNYSLTELQGEIMKLSLSHGTKTTNSHAESAQQQHPQQAQQQRQVPGADARSMRPEPSSGEPDVVSARSVPDAPAQTGHVTHPQPVMAAMPYPQPGYPGFMPGQYPVGYVPYPTIPPAQPYVPPPIGYAAYPHQQLHYPGMGYGQQPPIVSSQPYAASHPHATTSEYHAPTLQPVHVQESDFTDR